MYLIVGLGNPEEEYAHTRHNMGFDVINEIAKEYQIEVTKKKFQGLYGIGTIKEEKVILLKPQTYMNLSGDSVQEIMHFYQIAPENLIVIYDDMDVEKGYIKIRKKGGPGSHNGMKSVISQIGTEEFTRIRVGIGKPIYDRISYVIGKVPKEEYEVLQKGILLAKEAIVTILESSVDKAMNQFNERGESTCKS